MDEPPDKENRPWIKWRADRLTRQLKRLAEAAHRARREIIVSASGLCTGEVPAEGGVSRPDFEGALQNWPLWCREGLIDWMTFSNFHAQQTEKERFVHWVDFARTRKGAARMIVAISGSKNFDSGIMMQMRVALGRGADGVLLYSYQKPALNLIPQADFLGFLGRTVFSSSYVLPQYVSEAILPSPPSEEAMFPEVRIGEDDLPPPLPLDQLKTRPTPKTYTQIDAALALLGLDTRPSSSMPRPPAISALDKKIVSMDAQSPSSSDSEEPWVIVQLKTGQKFTAMRLSDDGDFTVFQMRQGGVVLSLRNADIEKVVLYAEEE